MTTDEYALRPSTNALAAGGDGFVADLVPLVGLAQEAIPGRAVCAVAAVGATDDWCFTPAAKGPARADRFRGRLRHAGAGAAAMGFRLGRSQTARARHC